MKLFEDLMFMDETTWQRHANPWSVYSRFTVLPALTLAIWSREWLGWWCVPLIFLAIFWNWYNPRAFAPVEKVSGWASEGVVGERIYLEKEVRSIRSGHVTAVRILSSCTALAAIIWVWGLWTQAYPAIFLALALTITFKAWVFDRMVWIYKDHKP